MDDRPAIAGKEPASPSGQAGARIVLGWIVTVLGALFTLSTIGVSLYVIFLAETTKQFAALLVSASFFAAFPALMGLGLIIWGRRMVLGTRAGGPPR